MVPQQPNNIEYWKQVGFDEKFIDLPNQTSSAWWFQHDKKEESSCLIASTTRTQIQTFSPLPYSTPFPPNVLPMSQKGEIETLQIHIRIKVHTHLNNLY